MTNRRQDDGSILQLRGEGVVSHPLSLMVALSETEPEVTLAKYAQRKLGKKAKGREGIRLEEVYLIKLNWLRKIARIQSKTHKHNLNNFRLTLEEVILHLQSRIL